MVNMTESEHRQPTTTLYCSNVHGTYNVVFLVAFNIILSVVASLGNFVILVALHKESSLHPPSKLLYRCLAITDLIVGFVSQPLFATQLLLDINERPHLCTRLGKWVDEISLVFSLVSGVIVTAISVDRLLALLLGLRYRHVVTLMRVGIAVSSIWLLGVICAFIDAFWPILGSIIIGYVINIVTLTCLIISAYCYTRILLRLRHDQAQIQGHVEQPAGPGIPLNVARYRRTVSAGVWVQITLVACYLPRSLVGLFGALFSLSAVSITLGIRCTTSLVFLNSSLNPFLYCWKMNGIRQAVKDLMKQYCCKSD